MVIDSRHGRDRRQVSLKSEVLGHRTIQAEDDVRARKRRAVVEPDALAQVELPPRRVDELPRDRKGRLDLVARVEVDERLMDLAVRRERREAMTEWGSKVSGLGRARPAEHVFRGR